MRLSKVRINNFKGIKDWEIDLKPGFNLIKGTNGKGKTSILEAIAVGMGGFLTGISGISGRHISKDEIRREYVQSGDGSYICTYQIPVVLELTAQMDDGQEITWKRSKNSIMAARSTTQPNTIKKAAEDMSNTVDIPLPVINYQGASRIWAQKKEKVDDIFRKHDKSLLMLGGEDEAKAQFTDDFIKDVKEAKYTAEVEEGILQLCDDLANGRVEMRIHKSSAMVRAKSWLCIR